MIFDPATASPWESIDDVVMGGVSRSQMSIVGGVAAFHGALSLERGGGFASVRSRPADLDLSPFCGLRLRVRGDGKRYQLRLRTTAAFDGVSYQQTFQTRSGEWQEVALRFEAFVPVFRGRRVPGHPPLDPSQVKTLGLMIADAQPGPFRLELASISGLPPP